MGHYTKWACLFLSIFVSFMALGIGQLDLFDLDETYFAEITREMMLQKTYSQIQFHGAPLYEKPPLFFWIQALSMHLWGLNAFGARFPNLVCGLVSLACIYKIGAKYKTPRFGLIWMGVYATAFLPHFYFKSGIIDPILNYFIFWAIYNLSQANWQNHTKQALWAGLCMGIALLLKGPIGLLIPLITTLLVYGISPLSRKLVFKSGCIALTILAIWLVPELLKHGLVFIRESFKYQLLIYRSFTPTHTHPWYYHFVILGLGCYPSSILALRWLSVKPTKNSDQFWMMMQALLATTLLIATLIGTKIVHYSSMAYWPITFFGAHGLYQGLDHGSKSKHDRLALYTGLTIGLILVLIPWLMLYNSYWLSFIENPNVHYALEMAMPWNYKDSLPGILYVVGVLSAFGPFLKNHVTTRWTLAMFMQLGSLNSFLMHIGPKIQAYAQTEMVNFCKAQKGQDVYLTTVGFKAAAPLFYAEQSLEKQKKSQDLSWLLQGPIDKTCLFIVYKTDEYLLKPYKDITLIKSVGCFAFYQRLPVL